ncbi:hypothetical protein [Sorangium sp. So ce406]|uniref:hypothetical protein n=1 Tax=Sorangium sp. So ce406 TaxID=3133311 RepID=UPI003F5C2EDB
MTTTEPMMHKEEGKVTTKIEERTAQVPSGAYLGLAIGSMVLSAGFMLAGKKQIANFVGQWVPSLLVIGIYNKLVKIEHEIGYRGAYR